MLFMSEFIYKGKAEFFLSVGWPSRKYETSVSGITFYSELMQKLEWNWHAFMLGGVGEICYFTLNLSYNHDWDSGSYTQKPSTVNESVNRGLKSTAAVSDVENRAMMFMGIKSYILIGSALIKSSVTLGWKVGSNGMRHSSANYVRFSWAR